MNTISIPPLIVERLGWVLLHSLWQFALIAVLAAITIRLLRHNSAALRYVVLGVAMIMTVVVPVATWILQPGGFPENPASQAVLAIEHERVVEHDDTLDHPNKPENGSNTTSGLASAPLNSLRCEPGFPRIKAFHSPVPCVNSTRRTSDSDLDLISHP